MMRAVLVALIILVGYDHIQYNGRFTSVAVQTSTSMLHHLRMR